MNRLLIVFGVSCACVGLYSSTSVMHTELQGELDAAKASLTQVFKHVGSVEEENGRFSDRLQVLKERLRQVRNTAPISDSVKRWIELDGSNSSNEEDAGKSLQALGISWETSPDAVLVPKATLTDLQMEAMSDSGRLSAVVGSVLDLNLDQIAAAQTALSKRCATYISWAATAVQRTPLSEPEIVRWEIPLNPEMEAALKRELNGELDVSIGQERRELLLRYIEKPLSSSFGNLGGIKATLTLAWREGADHPHPTFRHDLASKNQSLGTSFGSLVDDPPFPSDRKPLPPLFRPAFPGGWAELLAREGIALPAEK